MSLSRRRIIALLTLTTILLVTMDLRGSSSVDAGRRVFSDIMDPLQRAGRVVARPFEDAWRGVRDYDQLKEENDRLREQVAQQEGDSLAAIVAVREYTELQRLTGLEEEYSNVVAQVVQYSPQNFQQTVEINVGERQGVRAGMAVRSSAGLIGKVSRAFPDRSIVMLLTDPQYAVSVKVVGDQVVPGSSRDPNVATTTTTTVATGSATTDPTGLDVGELPDLTGFDPGNEGPAVVGVVPELDPGNSTTTSAPDTTLAPTTSSSIPLEELVHRELGGLIGRGPGVAPIVSLIAPDRRGLEISVGDVVATNGGCKSLAPADLPIGRVSAVIERPGSAGPVVEVEPIADLNELNFVLVILYLPPSEVPGTCE